jgi:hypothetical protein
LALALSAGSALRQRLRIFRLVFGGADGGQNFAFDFTSKFKSNSKPKPKTQRPHVALAFCLPLPHPRTP